MPNNQKKALCLQKRYNHFKESINENEPTYCPRWHKALAPEMTAGAGKRVLCSE